MCVYAQHLVFPPGFFDRADLSPDHFFYSPPRLVTHIDDQAIAAVGTLYRELGLTGEVLDLMSSWISHFSEPPIRLVALGMNEVELAANPQAHEWLIHDLNDTPRLPLEDDSFDAATCCVSVDYLTKPVVVFTDVARVLRPGGLFVVTFSNRYFPSKAIRGWLYADDAGHMEIVCRYFEAAEGWSEPVIKQCIPQGIPGDPLYAVYAEAI